MTPVDVQQRIRRVVVRTKLWQNRIEFQKNEYRIGVRPSIGKSNPFLKGYVSSDMSGKWQKEGIPISGNNYWTIGPPTRLGSSLRFDPTSNLYQAWFGLYTHIGIGGQQFGLKGETPDIELLKRLAEVDQEYWLKAYGDPKPLAQLTIFDERGYLFIGEHKAWLYYGEINSHSDVGLVGRGYEKAYGMVRTESFAMTATSKLHLFRPDRQLWDPYVNPYHRIKLKGFFAVVPFEKSIMCIYLNGAEYYDNNNRHHDTWSILENEALDLIKSVKITLI